MSETSGVGVFDWVIAEQVLARWWHLVALMKAPNLLHWVMCVLLYRCIVMAIKTTSKVGTCCIIVVLVVALAASGVIRSE